MFAFVKTPYWERADKDTKEGFAELIEQLGEQVEEIELLPSAIEAWELHPRSWKPRWRRNLSESGTKDATALGKAACAARAGAQVRAIDYQRARSGSRPSMKVSSSFSSSVTMRS